MATLDLLIDQINQLGSEERKQLVRSIASPSPELHPLIVSTPGICGGAARLIRTRIPVWTIERMRQLDFTEQEILDSFPTLSPIDLEQARRYADDHREEIDDAITANEED